jgi:glycosyltransferase involved in cell wall biosynthesis
VKGKIQYVTFDSLEEGVGASQVLSYLLKLSSEFDFTLINFEKETPSEQLKFQLMESGIDWKPLYFGRKGLWPGFSRVIRLSRLLNPRVPIHARGDLAGLAAALSGSKKILWDCRALTADQRFGLSSSFSRFLIYLINRLIEKIVAKRSAKINVITTHASKILCRRYNLNLEKFSHISTCVDLEKFSFSPLPLQKPIKLFIPGTLSFAYDIQLMNSIINEIRKNFDLEVTVAISKGAEKNWMGLDFDNVVTLPHREIAMEISKSHFGMSIWKSNLGLSLASVSSTKIPEFLASGRPVVANFNQGDIGFLLEEFRCGVTTSLNTESYVQTYVKDLIDLLNDKDLPARCRKLAKSEYSLTHGVRQLSTIYQELQVKV